VWVGAVGQLGGSTTTALGAAVDLEHRYAEPHRRYHTIEHVQAVLWDASWLAAELGVGVAEQAVVVLAACAHDVVHDARPGDDERASAEWARARLTESGVPTEAANRVAGLVLATASHVAADDDVATAVLLDADLAVLGGEPDAYADYVAAVRREYSAIPDPQWRAGRAQVLTALVGRERLYVTAPARARWEAAARANVAGELAGLR
jgi:predicted metal-dependent HD superfamily phosphohydrolase